MSFANGRWVKDWIAPKPRTVAVAIVVVFVLSLAAFLWDVDTPNVMMFDETWYVPTAQKWLAAGKMMHEEHPPLGKLMIALGMWLFGDNPFGWRVMSAGFGALAVSGTFLWAFALLRSVPQALWAAAVVFCSHVVFVQARIAMLDIFLMAFCTLALAFFTFSIKEPDRRRSLGYALAMGVCLGLASACKWSGFFLLFGLAGAYLLIALLRTWRVRFEDPRTTDFYAPGGWPAMTPSGALLAFIVAPLLAYFAAFLPQIVQAGTPLEFIDSHARMFDVWGGVSAPHPYASLWPTWLWMKRPVWYYFFIPGGVWSHNPASAVVALVNPFVLAAGEAAILVAIHRWIVRRDLDSMIVAVGFLSQYLPWLFNPKGLEFSFYFFPSVMCFAPALALVVFRGAGTWRGWAAVGVPVLAAATFLFFLPVLAGGIGVDAKGYYARMWLKSWI